MGYIIRKTSSYNRYDKTQNKWFLSQQSKQKRSKINIGIFTAMFRFPNRTPEIESTWPTVKYRGRKFFDTWYYIATCATFHILESKARDQSNQAKKKLFSHVIVKNYLSNVSWKFLIKIESTWRCEIKEQAPQLASLCRGKTVMHQPE